MPNGASQSRGNNVEPITRQKLSDQVYDRLWDMIANGEFKPGDAIPSERKLMERFAVGRPAVREALQALAGKGVITISHGERSRVNELNAGLAFDQIDNVAKLLLSSQPSNLSHLKEARKILEIGTVRAACKNASVIDIKRLRDIVEIQKSLSSDPKGFVQTDIMFHTTIADISRNPLLQAVTQAMLTWLFEYYKPLLHWSGRENTTLLEHEKIVDHLEAGNADRAAEVMHQHLDRSEPLYTTAEKSTS